MNNFNKIEDVYMALAQEILAFVGNRNWDKAGGKYEIYATMVSSEWWMENENGRDETGDIFPDELRRDAISGIRFLRKNLLETTGNRIWGVDFTLFPDGKFNVEYNYNKPDDYEESDETITGEEINQSLSDGNKK